MLQFLRRPRRFAQATLAMVVLAGAVVGFAGVAAAHHAEITGSAGCGGVVNFTATAWVGEPDDPSTAKDEYVLSRTNSRVEVAISKDGGPYVALPQLAEYRFDTGNGYAFSDTITLIQPLPDTVTLRVQELVNWANTASPGAPRYTTAMTVTGCAGASVGEIVCAANNSGADVTLSNPTVANVQFTITKTVGGVDTIIPSDPVAALGGTATVRVPIAEDETATIKVEAPGTTTITQTRTRNCERQAAEIGSIVCAEGGATVTLTNTGGGLPVTFRVNKGAALVEEVVVPANGSDTVFVAFNEDESATVSVTSGNATLASESLSRNCERPGATIADVVCAEGGAKVTLTNNGGLLPVTFTINDGVNPATTVVVAAGGTATPVIPVAEDATVTLTVTAPGMAPLTKSVNRDCQRPAASVADVVCATDGAAVTVSNVDGQLPIRFTVTKNGTVVATHDVPAGGTASSVVPLAENESALIAANAPGMVEVAKNVTRDCQRPAAVIADVVCTEDGAKVTLTNISGELPVRFAVIQDGGQPAAVDVPADGTVTRTLALVEDQPSTILVTAPTMADVTKSVIRNCTEEVQATNLAAPGSGVLGAGTGRGAPAVGAGTLPRTGASTTRQLTIGAITLLGIGAVLLAGSRRHTTA